MIGACFKTEFQAFGDENNKESSAYRKVVPRWKYGNPWIYFFLICLVGGGIKVHSTLRPLNGLLCQPRVIMIMEKSVEW
jgi:hypothetical protein